MRNSRLAILLALLGALPLWGKTWTRSFEVHGRPEVHIAAHNAAISVQAWNQPNVQIEIVSRAWGSESNAFEADAHQSGNLISLQLRTPSQFFSFGGRSIHITVETPSPANLVLDSTNGALRVQGIAGELELNTTNGSIHTRDTSGELRSYTTNGAIQISGGNGNIRAHTTNGSLRLRGRLSGLQAQSSNGSMHIVAEEGSRVSSRWTLTSGNGSIHLRLPRDLSARLETRTGLGSAHCSLPLKQNTSNNSISRHELSGTLNQGGGVIAIRTGNGSVRID